MNRKINGYLSELAKSEQAENEKGQGSVQEALSKLHSRQKKLDTLAQEMDESYATQCCETEPEAKRMRSRREGIVVGYNIQAAVEDETGLIVHHDVTDEGADNRQLEPMAKAAQSELGADKLTV